MPGLPTGTVTFLFTDLESSSRLWEEHPEAMKGALARHDEILREAVEAQNGHVVKMTGDGLHAVFAIADHALASAVSGQVAIEHEPWTDMPRLRVRMGIHTGTAEGRGGDYYGPTPNRAARLAAAGHGGQVLVSHATEELVRDALPVDVTLRDLGEHRLRDLARPDRIFQVEAFDLDTEFAPLRTLDSFPGNLPVQLTSFVAREREMKSLADALGTSRLVTLTGVGGVGKTRLATQVAADLVTRFEDGAWLCELAGASDGDSMVQLVAATLGAQARGGMSLEDSVVQFLSPKKLLLVLDNCEHVLDAAGRFAEAVLGSCAGVRIVATSREGLAVAGEQVWPLRSLGLPASSELDAVVASDAGRLFAERAVSARPTFVIDPGNADAVADLCVRLDGMPLAIELAAARVVSMSPPEIGRRLDERFRLLTGGRRTAVERHQTLRATIDWSYSLLEDRDRLVFERLGVFVGGFDSEAAEAVTTGEGIEAWDVVDALTDLVAKSLVVPEETLDGTTRYELLETLRVYALERLDERGDADHWRRRHAEHYASFAEDAGPALGGPEELRWRRRLGAELDNLRSAVTWALDAENDEDREHGLRIVAALAIQEGYDPSLGVGTWAARALDAAEETLPGRRHAVLAAAAYRHVISGDFDHAIELAHAALRDGIPSDSPWPGLATSVLSYVDVYRGEPVAGAERLEAFLASPQVSMLDLPERVTFLSIAGGLQAGEGDLARGRELTEQALELARRSGNPSALGGALYPHALTIQTLDPDRAISELEEIISLSREGAIPVLFGYANGALAMLRAARGERDSTLSTLRAAVAFSASNGDHTQLMSLCVSGILALGSLSLFEAVPVIAGHIADILEVTASNPASQQEAVLAALTRARDDLGAETFDAELERGRSMSYDEFVRYYLAVLDALLTDD